MGLFKQSLLCAAVLATIAGAAKAVDTCPLVINEVFQNPDTSSDNKWEYIEISGPAGMSLTGYAVALVNGGVNPNGDADCTDGGERCPEIDEYYPLDGKTLSGTLGSSGVGYFVIYNSTTTGVPGGTGDSEIYFEIDGGANTANMKDLTSGADDLQNDGSTTYVLLRARPAGSPAPWRRDAAADDNFDSLLNAALEPYQMVHNFAWSDENGKEYTRDGADEINHTPDMNPDQITLVKYFTTPTPARGKYYDDATCKDTERADESFIYGENRNNVHNGNIGRYDFRFDGSDARQSKGPTNLGASKYTCSSSGDPDVDSGATADAMGEYLKDYFTTTTNYYLSPGSANNTVDSGAGFGQVAFDENDINMDGTVDCVDYCLVSGYNGSGADLDDTNMDGSYKYQGVEFQKLLLATLLDGTQGDTVAGGDVTAHSQNGMCGCLMGDVNEDGRVDMLDITLLMDQQKFGEYAAVYDLNNDGVLDIQDVSVALGVMK